MFISSSTWQPVSTHVLIRAVRGDIVGGQPNRAHITREPRRNWIPEMASSGAVSVSLIELQVRSYLYDGCRRECLSKSQIRHRSFVGVVGIPKVIHGVKIRQNWRRQTMNCSRSLIWRHYHLFVRSSSWTLSVFQIDEYVKPVSNSFCTAWWSSFKEHIIREPQYFNDSFFIKQNMATLFQVLIKKFHFYA
jgi:hypothetical protein